MSYSYNPRKYRKKIISEINIVPYIDICLVLLVIFMITAPLQQNAVDITLPTANGAKIEAQQQLFPFIILISKTGQYYLTDKDNTDRQVTLAEVLFQAADMNKNTPQSHVYIKADQTVDYGKVVSVMQALKKAGVSQVGLITSPAEL